LQPATIPSGRAGRRTGLGGSPKVRGRQLLTPLALLSTTSIKDNRIETPGQEGFPACVSGRSRTALDPTFHLGKAESKEDRGGARRRRRRHSRRRDTSSWCSCGRGLGTFGPCRGAVLPRRAGLRRLTGVSSASRARRRQPCGNVRRHGRCCVRGGSAGPGRAEQVVLVDEALTEPVRPELPELTPAHQLAHDLLRERDRAP
jgi:hypothetical protein